MKKIYLLIIVTTLLVTSIMGQNLTQTIRGQILDSDTKQPLVGANILIEKTSPALGASTDINGKFFIEKVPVGRHTIKAVYIGYQDYVVSELLVGSGKEVILSIYLKENIIESETIVVIAEQRKDVPINSMATVSARTFTVEETQRYAASINDPSRLAQSYAGVSSADDENNELIIRGNSPRGMLWRLEGIEIPNPNHFRDGEGASGGGVSILSSQMLSNSDFFTGAFPAEYGNAMAGVFDIKLRKGNPDKREYTFQLGVMGADISAEGPFIKGQSATYLFNYRYSTLTMLNKLGIKISDEVIVPIFQDLSFKFHFPTSAIGVFSLFGLAGKSDAGDSAIEDSTEWEYRSDRFREKEYHEMGVIGLSNFYAFSNKKTYLKSVLAVSAESHTVKQDSLDDFSNYNQFYKDTFTYNTIRFSVTLNHKFNASHVIRTGIIYSRLGFDIYARGLDFDKDKFVTWVNNDGNTGVLQGFGQWKWRPGQDLSINSGLHYTQFLLNNHSTFEPRLGLKWQIREDQAINAGVGFHSRVETISNYLAKEIQPDESYLQPNKDLDLSKAFHAVLGYDKSFSNSLRLKLEAYYQYLYDVPIEDDPGSKLSALNYNEGFATIPLINEGSGENYGIEITFEKFLSDNYYFLGTASLFESKYIAGDKKERNTQFNGNYVFNLLGGKEFLLGNKNNILGFNGRLIWKGGNRYTPINLPESISQGETVRYEERTFEAKAPDYFRLDIGINFRKNNPGWAWILSLDIQNVTNRLNIHSEYFDSSANKIRKNTLLGFVPILNYRLEF